MISLGKGGIQNKGGHGEGENGVLVEYLNILKKKISTNIEHTYRIF